MPEADTASVSYAELLAAVARYLGYDADSLTASQTAECDAAVQSGVRQFYYPPAIENGDPAHEWSFLRSEGTVTTTADEDTLALPDGFGSVVGDLHFPVAAHLPSVTMVGEAAMERLRRAGHPHGPPRHFCQAWQSTGTAPAQLLLWPCPDRAYTLSFRMEGDTGRLNATTRTRPLGGARHAELVTESCLAIAEQRSNDELGIHTKLFRELLASAIAQDKRFAAGNLGPMSIGCCAPPCQQNFLITYKGYTW